MPGIHFPADSFEMIASVCCLGLIAFSNGILEG